MQHNIELLLPDNFKDKRRLSRPAIAFDVNILPGFNMPPDFCFQRRTATEILFSNG
jgi:hypothetical protein